ncbi:hypothetical protein [Mesorhizobium sp.]|uniref:hypothetical protein n=1 Tax=Mesorhizobium sp. TaxID=1871066 RepID=UPI0025B9E806|nr:hypothetical protein [Mesorhizobium sp.]
MMRKDMRLKRRFRVKAVFVFDCAWPLSDRLADPTLPPILMQLPAASLRSGHNHCRQLSNPRLQNQPGPKKSQRNQVCINHVSSELVNRTY